jgi:cell wall-associated NlpC family hydrolase
MGHVRQAFIATSTLMLSLALAGCSSLPPVNPQLAARGQLLVSQAKALVGSPYQYGGNSPTGFDCSGFVQYTFRKVGIKVPRTTQAQLKKSSPIQLSRLQPGDLIFFRLSGRKISHVGIYVGNDQMIHAPSSGKHVAYASLDSDSYWRSRIIASGRFY